MEALLPALEKRARELGVDVEDSPRVKSARIAHELAQGLVNSTESIKVIERLAGLEIPSEPHIGTALASADSVRDALTGERWTLLGVAIDRASTGEAGFAEVIASLRDALATDEFAARLEPAVAKAYDDAVKLIGAAPPAPPEPTPPPPPPPPPGVSVVRGDKSGLDLDEARRELDRLSAEEGEVQVDLRWTITTKSVDA